MTGLSRSPAAQSPGSAWFALKQAVFETMAEREDVNGLRDTLAFSQLLDGLGLWTFECFARAREEIIVR